MKRTTLEALTLTLSLVGLASGAASCAKNKPADAATTAAGAEHKCGAGKCGEGKGAGASCGAEPKGAECTCAGDTLEACKKTATETPAPDAKGADAKCGAKSCG